MPGVQLHILLWRRQRRRVPSVDLRGFGAFATPNTLVLHQRTTAERHRPRPLSTFRPFRAIRSSASKLSAATAAPCCMATMRSAASSISSPKTGVGGPPVAMRGEAGVGSFNQRMASVSAATNFGPWSTSFYGNGIKSDGYRDNNALDQRNGVGNINYTTPDLTAFLTVTGDDQKLGFPGGRIGRSLDRPQRTGHRPTEAPAPRSTTATSRAPAPPPASPRPCGAASSSSSMVAYGTRTRRADSSAVRCQRHQLLFQLCRRAHCRTWSITPRLSIKNTIFGMPSSEILTGIDYYDATYPSGTRVRSKAWRQSTSSISSQQTLAGYWQQTLGLLPTTDFAYGAPGAKHQR